MSAQGGAGRREVAWRLFAAEYDDATLEHSDSDEERAPNYVVTPTGARVNRLFVVGVLTEIEQVGDEVLRARVVDPTGGFVIYAGQYQPDALAFLERAEPPMFVAVTGKARTFQPEDSDVIYTSVRPESINAVDAETRDRWTVQTAEQTLSRVRTMAGALELDERGDALRRALEASSVDAGLAAGVPLALDHYHTSTPYLAELRDVAIDAARTVAGETDEVRTLAADPDEPGEAVIDVDADTSFEVPEPEPEAEPTAETGGEPAAEAEPEAVAESETAEATTEPESGTAAEPEAEAETEAGPDTGPEAETPPAQAREPSRESAEPGTEAAEAGDELGDFDSGDEDELGDFDEGTEESGEGSADLDADEQASEGTFGGEMYEFDEEEREQIEEEFGTEFSTGAEVGEPGEAGIETPEPGAEAAESEPDEGAEPTAEAEGRSAAEAEPEPATGETAEPDVQGEPEPETGEPEVESEPEPEEEPEPEAGAEGAGEAPDNLENAVMEIMRELNGGDGVGRDQLTAAVVDRYDVTPADVEDALQDALMAGRCYESGEDTLKPI